MTLKIIIFAMTIAVTLFAAALLLSRQTQRPDQEGFLAGFLGLYALLKLDQLYLATHGYQVLPHLAGIMFCAKFLLPALIFFYARALTSPLKIGLRKQDWPALVAPGIAVLVATPYFNLTAQEKIALMDPSSRDPILYQRAILGCQIGLMLFVAVSLVYLGKSFQLFQQHSKRLKDLFSRIDDKTISWLRWVLLILAVGWSGYGFNELWGLTGKRPTGAYTVFQVFELCWIGAIAFFGVQQTSVYRPEQLPSDYVQSTDNSGGIDKSYVNSSLSNERKQLISDKLANAMEQSRLFEDPDLSLRQLSDQINVPENHISETFSQTLSTRFFDYVNGYRIAQAKQWLEQTDKTIVNIAFDVGFNSRSTFNAAFKKLTGVTPSQFRRQHRTVEPVDTQSA